MQNANIGLVDITYDQYEAATGDDETEDDDEDY